MMRRRIRKRVEVRFILILLLLHHHHNHRRLGSWQWQPWKSKKILYRTLPPPTPSYPLHIPLPTPHPPFPPPHLLPKPNLNPPHQNQHPPPSFKTAVGNTDNTFYSNANATVVTQRSLPLLPTRNHGKICSNDRRRRCSVSWFFIRKCYRLWSPPP